MRTFILSALLPAFAFADVGYGGYGAPPAAPAVASSAPASSGDYTVTTTHTSTGTKTNILTAYMTKVASSSVYPVYSAKSNSTSSAVVVKPSNTFVKPSSTFVKPVSVTTSAGPVQATANGAAQNMISVAMAGVVGAGLYFVL